MEIRLVVSVVAGAVGSFIFTDRIGSMKDSLTYGKSSVSAFVVFMVFWVIFGAATYIATHLVTGGWKR